MGEYRSTSVSEHLGDLGENEFHYGISEKTAEISTDRCSRYRVKRLAGCVHLMREQQALSPILCRENSDV
jgi:hypothetical protein